MAKTAGGIRSSGRKSVVERAKEKISSILGDIRSQGFSRITPFKIGGVEKRMKDYAAANGITLGSNDVYMSSSSIAHAMRGSKAAKGITVSEKDLIGFPSGRKKMDLYFDSKTGNFTYTDGKAKYIVHPNYSVKLPSGKSKVVNFITAQKLDTYESFSGNRFKKI